jgi:hypothetical protein
MADNLKANSKPKTNNERKALVDMGISGRPADNKGTDKVTIKQLPKSE